MAVIIAIRFPLGRYHATPWDSNVNEGVVEWPPSPWRILRALVATWYTRWPDLPARDFDALLAKLGGPPSYRTPHHSHGHSRHYLPDSDHKKSTTGNTDLTLDPFIVLSRTEPLLVRWDVDLTSDEREALSKLVELLPHLGRADSVCDAQLSQTDIVPDENWWTPMSNGTGGDTRLLASAEPVSRPALEVTTVNVRKTRRTVPQHSRWISYQAPKTTTAAPSSPADSGVKAVRYAIYSRMPTRAVNGVLVADALHEELGRRLRGKISEDQEQSIFGKSGATTDHQHAHWIPLSDRFDRSGHVKHVVVWVPAGLPSNVLVAMIKPFELDGRRREYDVKGLPPVTLVLQAMGEIHDVAPELCGEHRRWSSATPYLPVRHRKVRDMADRFLTADIQHELAYRGLPPALISRREPGDGIADRWALSFRRYRLSERLANARPGLGLTLEFEHPVAGPLLLGQLSHFGLGVFHPENDHAR